MISTFEISSFLFCFCFSLSCFFYLLFIFHNFWMFQVARLKMDLEKRGRSLRQVDGKEIYVWTMPAEERQGHYIEGAYWHYHELPEKDEDVRFIFLFFLF